MRLTQSQKEVLEQVIEGKTGKVIASELKKSESNVSMILHRAKLENGAENTFQLVAMAFREGILK